MEELIQIDLWHEVNAWPARPSFRLLSLKQWHIQRVCKAIWTASTRQMAGMLTFPWGWHCGITAAAISLSWAHKLHRMIAVPNICVP